MTNQEYNDACWHTIRPRAEHNIPTIHPLAPRPHSAEYLYIRKQDLQHKKNAYERRKIRGFRNTASIEEQFCGLW